MKKIILIVSIIVNIHANAQFSEGFENGMPTDWTIINGGDANTWNAGLPIGGAHSGTKVARIFYSADAHDDYLVTRQFTVTNNLSNRISFWYRHLDSALPEPFNIMISTTGTAAGNFSNLIPNQITPTTTWQQISFNLNAYLGQLVYIAFRSTTTEQYHLYLDDISVDAVPTTIPTCSSGNISTPDPNCGSRNTPISWNIDPNVTGYFLNVGTTSGGNNVVNNQNIGNVNSFAIPNQSADTTYFWKITPYNLIGQATTCPEYSYTTFFAPCYCTPTPFAVDGRGITNFSMGTINKSTYDVIKYDDFSALVTNAAQASVQPFSIKVETGYVYKMNIWVDWNDDYDFDDFQEIAFEGLSSAAIPNFVTGTITVPSNALLGQHRLRVGGQDTPTVSSCYSGSLFACFEDYTVNVTQSLANNQFEGFDFKITSDDLSNGNLTIQANQNFKNSVLSIYDLQGREICQKTVDLALGSTVVAINSTITSGIYIININTDFGKYSQKVFVR